MFSALPCGEQLMLWKKKNGKSVFTGLIFRQEPTILTEWTSVCEPNCYKLVNKKNINGRRIPISISDFLKEMKQYD